MSGTLAYIVPTIGRPSLRATLDSLGAPAIVVAETGAPVPPGLAADAVHGMGCGHGNAQRNRALALAREQGYTHVAYMDDDDVAMPGAAGAILAGIDADPDALHLFRARLPNGETVWRDEAIRAGNVGTPCIVHPTGVLSRWQDAYESDIMIAADLARELGRVVWHTGTVCLAKPWPTGWETRTA